MSTSSSSSAHPSVSASTSTTTTTTMAALQGTTTTASILSSLNNAAFSLDDFDFPLDLTTQDHKDEALRALKSDLMDELNKEMKSLDEDGWMFEGPRSRINLIARPGGFFSIKANQISNMWQLALRR